jgi:hypothetical protein
MNGMLFRSAIALAACAALSSSAFAQPVKPPTGVTVKEHMTLTCKDPNPPGVFRQADGGYVETSHGWFYNAQIRQSTNFALAYCYTS